MTYTMSWAMDFLNQLTQKPWCWPFKRRILVLAARFQSQCGFREIQGKKIGQYFADLIIQETILLELKAARSLDKAHEAQYCIIFVQRTSKSGFFSTSASVPNSAAFSSTTKERKSVRIRG
jgi:PD-(D/E)XK nuclease superfamily protein